MLSAIHVAPSPHVSRTGLSTRRMMIDVLIALLPSTGMAIYLFRLYAVKQIAICLVSCLVAELLFVKFRRKAISLADCSAAVTGMILALSLPATAPWYIAVIASVAAIGIGKIIFGGLGMNIFNPAMVGRAFVMISFASVMGAAAYTTLSGVVDAVSQATPMDILKQTGTLASPQTLFFGVVNGSLGETSALACLLGGCYLCLRGSAAWQIPSGVLLASAVIAALADLANGFTGMVLLHHLSPA